MARLTNEELSDMIERCWLLAPTAPEDRQLQRIQWLLDEVKERRATDIQERGIRIIVGAETIYVTGPGSVPVEIIELAIANARMRQGL